MIILFILLIAILVVILFLRGEGGSFGKGNDSRIRNKERSFDFSDKNFFI